MELEVKVADGMAKIDEQLWYVGWSVDFYSKLGVFNSKIINIYTGIVEPIVADLLIEYPKFEQQPHRFCGVGEGTFKNLFKDRDLAEAEVVKRILTGSE